MFACKRFHLHKCVAQILPSKERDKFGRDSGHGGGDRESDMNNNGRRQYDWYDDCNSGRRYNE